MDAVVGAPVVGVAVGVAVFEEVTPHRDCTGCYLLPVHLALAVAQEVAVEVALGQVAHVAQVTVVELKVSRELVEQLRDTV